MIAFDLSPICVAAAKLRVPGARIECRDTREPFVALFPMGTNNIHRPENLGMSEARGIFLCRLNSTDDHNFGAGSGTHIQENFYVENGQKKRFFDKIALKRLLVQGCHQLSMEPMTSRKYLKQKATWKVVLEKVK